MFGFLINTFRGNEKEGAIEDYPLIALLMSTLQEIENKALR